MSVVAAVVMLISERMEASHSQPTVDGCGRDCGDDASNFVVDILMVCIYVYSFVFIQLYVYVWIHLINYSIATAHSAGPGMRDECCMLCAVGCVTLAVGAIFGV